MDNLEAQKLTSAKEAVKYIRDDEIIGLGTGTTIKYLLDELALRIKNEGMNITAVSTSNRTTSIARELGIKVIEMDELKGKIDLTIDGVDQSNYSLNGIKGGGGALLREKIVATNSDRNIWVADSTKIVDEVGSFKLPVEVVTFGYEQLFREFEDKGWNPSIRKNSENEFYLTDQGNYIFDLDMSGQLNTDEDMKNVAKKLKSYVGVVEHGLFIDIAGLLIIGEEDDNFKIIKK